MSLVVLVVFVSPKTTLSFSPCVTRAVLSFLKIHPEEEISLWSTSSCLLASVTFAPMSQDMFVTFILIYFYYNSIFFPLIKKTNKVSCVNWKDLQFTSIFLCSFIDLRGCGVCTCAEVRGQHYLRVISSLLPCDSVVGFAASTFTHSATSAFFKTSITSTRLCVWGPEGTPWQVSGGHAPP